MVGMTTTDLLKTGDVARLLGVSRQHVVDMCERGEMAFTFVGKHRRIRSAEVARLSGTLTRDQERSLWLHQALLGELLSQPIETLDMARENIMKWRESHRADGMTVRYLDEWSEIIDSGLDRVVETITSRAPQACELRQNSPFAGVLPDATRIQVLKSFNQHWSVEHQLAA